MGTDFLVRTNWRFSNSENSFIRKYRPGTNVSGLTNHHCISLKRFCVKENICYSKSSFIYKVFTIFKILDPSLTYIKNAVNVHVIVSYLAYQTGQSADLTVIGNLVFTPSRDLVFPLSRDQWN